MIKPDLNTILTVLLILVIVYATATASFDKVEIYVKCDNLGLPASRYINFSSIDFSNISDKNKENARNVIDNYNEKLSLIKNE